MTGKLNKKAISPLIATVIIIAITVAAGIVLYAMVFPLINKPLTQTTCIEVTFELDAEASCVEVNDAPPPGFGAGDNNTVKVSIDRTKSADDEPGIVEWKLILDAGEGERRSVSIPTTFVVNTGEQKTHTDTFEYDSTSPNDGLLFDLKGYISRISVYPVINVRNTQVSCEEITQTINRLRACA